MCGGDLNQKMMHLVMEINVVMLFPSRCALMFAHSLIGQNGHVFALSVSLLIMHVCVCVCYGV